MRLFLSSYRAGKYNQKLIELVGRGSKVAFISNAKDYKTPDERELKVQESLDYWNSIGLKPKEVDLRPYFHKNGAEKLISGFNCVWLAGGNVFLLRRALRYSGIDKYLYDAVRKNEVILCGESAGAIIMGPTLRHSEMEGDEDNPHHIPQGYQPDVILEGLDFISYVPVPHYQDPDYGLEIDKYISRLGHDKIAYKTMTNDQAIIINGDKEEFLE